MAYKLICLILLAICHAKHASADVRDVAQLGKAMPKAFVPTGQMPRLSVSVPVRPETFEVVRGSLFQMLEAPSSYQFGSTLHMRGALRASDQGLQEGYQQLRARMQKMPKADSKHAQHGSGLVSLMVLMASAGLVASIGTAAVRKYFAHGEQAPHSMVGFQIPYRSRPIEAMARVVLFNKPCGVLSQFSKGGTSEEGQQTLADFMSVPDVYPAGRLDKDSEGLLILTDDGILQSRIASPKTKTPKVYWAQVERVPTEEALEQLRKGVQLKDGMTRPAKARLIKAPDIWPRDPPIRERKEIPTAWIELSISEGKNRQVRRMTAAVGFPTLRLIRVSVGPWRLRENLQSGDYQLFELSRKECARLLEG